MTSGARRIIALADTDSYVKWAAALLTSLPAEVETELVIVETPLAVSAGQLRGALAGTRFDPDAIRRVPFAELPGILSGSAADAVLLASRGPVVRVLAAAVAALDPRPVIVTGLPGISIPATTAALIHRTQCDLFVLHSVREVRDFTGLARRRGLVQRFGLATLPFAEKARIRDRAEAGTDLVFASQAIVPRERADRMRVARMLVAAAEADPTRRVVVKERAVAGEQQTHRQKYAYPDLLAKLGAPTNLIVSHVPMSRALDDAEGLVTVSSTAAIEAVATGVPVIVLDTFGIDDKLINPVFVGSGLFGSEQAMRERDFRMPADGWLADNYFHDPDADDWVARVDELVALRRRGALAPKPARVRRGGRVRDVWERKLAFGRYDRSLAGAAVLVVGVPLRFVLRPLLRPYHRRRLRAA